MILRRLSTAIRKQDWFTVLVETLIVVFGVFIGLQVNNWNAARGDRTDGRVALERLEQDFELILQRTDLSLASHTANLESAGRLIQGIRNKKFEEETILLDISHAADFSTLPGTSATFIQLVSSGRLELIRNQDLRRALTEYDAYIKFVTSQYGTLMTPLTEARHTLTQASTLQVTNIPTTDFFQLDKRDDVDRNILLNNPEMLAALQTSYQVQDNIYALLYRFRGLILDILNQIRAEQENTS